MKKLWYLLPTLIFALGVVACGEDDTQTDPTPPPSGPTEEVTPQAVKDLVVKAGLNQAELSWTLPSDQSNIKKIKIGVKASGENTIDWTVVDQVCSSYTVTDLDEPAYYFEVRTVNVKKESVGATSDLIDIYTLDAFSEPKFEMYEDETGWTLKATNLSTSTSVFHSIEWSISDTRATVCEGEYTASAEELAAMAQNKSTITEMEWLTEYEFDNEVDYAISYKITVYPALGGALNTSDNSYYYEGGILDQTTTMEEASSEVVTQLTPEPLVLHFWGGDSPNVMYEQIAFAWDAPFGVEKYLIYYGADFETATVVELEKGSDQIVEAHAVSASDPVGEYAKVWSADKAYIIKDMTTSPAYVRVEAIDSYDRVMAMGQYYTYNFTVRADQKDIQDHQPKFSIEYQTKGEHQYQWAVTAKHISAARAYAKIFSWKVKSGDEVVAEGTCQPDAVSIGYKTEPQLREYSWYFDESKFNPETKYTVEYELTYVPTTNSYETGEKTPLDYNPETKEFTPAANPDKPTGIAHDPRVLRPLVLDADGNIKYRTRVGDDDKVYTYYDEECRYITLSHCNYDHSRKEIIIKSSDIAAANSDISFEVTSSEKPDNLALDLNVKAEIDEGTERKSTEKGHRGLRSINGIYQSVNLTWNHPSSAGIESITINDGSKDIVLTADNWAVAEGKGAYTVTDLKTSPANITVTAKKGGEEYASDTVQSDVYTISDVDVKFEIVKNEDGSWSINAYGIAGENFSFYSLSFNLYKNGSAVFNKNITKNGDDSIKGTIEAWITNRGASSYTEVNNGDWDGDEFDKITFDKLEYATEYEVRYELVAFPVIYDAVADAEDYHKHPEWIYYSRLNTTTQALGEMTTSVATPGAPDDSEMSQIKITGVAINDFQKANCRWEDVSGASYYVAYYGNYDEGAKLGNLKTESQVEAAVAAAEKSLTKSEKIAAPAKLSDQAPFTYESAHWPAYVMVVAYNAEDKPIAAGQANNYVYTVSADNPVIQHHQPTFSVKFLQEKWYVTVSHISSALGYAKSIKWEMKDAEGKVVASRENSVEAVAKSDKTPAMKELSWGLNAADLDGKTTYTFDYEIVYVPVGNKWKHESDDSDFRTLRKCEKVDGHFQHQLVDGTYAAYSAECDYMYNAEPLAAKSVTITSAALKEAGVDLAEKTTVTTSEKTEQLVLNLKSDIDEGTSRIDTQYDSYVGLKSLNGLYQSAQVSWDQPETGVTSAQIRYGTEVINVSVADLTVKNGRASYVVEGLTESYYDFAVALYAGEEEISAETASADIYTLPEQSTVTFEVAYDSDKDGWSINIPTGLSTKYYATWVVSFNIYEQGSSTPVFTNNVTKNGKEDIITFKKWMARGYVDYHMTNNDWDTDCTPEYANKMFTGLKFSTNYDIEYTLQVFPMIYDPDNAKNSNTCFGHKRMLMNSEATNGTYEFKGKVSIMTESQPANPAVSELKLNGHAPRWQEFGAQITPINKAVRYEVYYGDYADGVQLGTLRTVSQVEAAVAKAASMLTKVDTFSNASNGSLEFYASSKYWPTYMMAVGYDADNKPIAAGQMNCYNYTLSADNKMLQHHQPKFTVAWDNTNAKWKVTASHISSALGFASKIKWSIDGTSVSGEYEVTGDLYNADATPVLKAHDWLVEADKLANNTTYTFTYEITYAPTSNKWYDPKDNWSGDFRDMRMCEMDGDLYKCATTGNYMSRDENCNYVYAMASYGKGHAPLKGHPTLPDHLVTISSTQLPTSALHNKATTDSRKDFAVAVAIDEGTVLGRTLWGNNDSWYTGLASVNGLFASVKLSWTKPSGADKIVITYGDQTVEVTDGSTSKIIEGIKTSPVEFTIKACKGTEELYSETISTDVYVLPEADTSAQWVAQATGSGYQILGTGWNTKQYTACHVTFNIYEKGNSTPVFDKDVNYKGSLSSIIAWTMGEIAPNGVCYAGGGNRACHGGDGNNWDENNLPSGASVVDGKEIFTGLDSSKEYVVKYTLKVWPYIYDANNRNNVELYTNASGQPMFNYFFKKMLISGTAASYYNAIDLNGEATLTFK